MLSVFLSHQALPRFPLFPVVIRHAEPRTQHHSACIFHSLLYPPSEPPYSQYQSSPAPMKNRRGGAGFPFPIGCMSQSAVAVADPLDKKPPAPAPQQQADNPFSSTTTTATAQDRVPREEGTGGEEKAKEGIVTAGVHRLLKGIKTFFAAYDGEEEEEREIVIGYPTDVQRVGHIGWDGLNKVGGMVGALSLPSSLSLRHRSGICH